MDALGPALEGGRPLADGAHDPVADRHVVVDDVELGDRGRPLGLRKDHAVRVGDTKVAPAGVDDGLGERGHHRSSTDPRLPVVTNGRLRRKEAAVSRSMETWTDAQLLAATPGDPAAFGAWYRRHEHDVLAFFRYGTRSAELAADLTAETFAAALESIATYRPELGEPRPWLFGIARHVLARSLARGRVENRARAALALPPLVVDDEAIERIENRRLRTRSLGERAERVA